MRRIDYWHVKFTYLGSRKIAVKLREDDYKVGRKMVRRLMQLMSIYSISPKANLSKRNFKESIVPYLLRNYAVNFPSIYGKSRWADNIMIERWFRSLKTEQIYPNEYHSPKELRKLIGDYVHAYNTERPHEALEYAIPDTVYYGMFAT